VPLPNGWLLLLEPSDLVVIVPDPNFWVWPVTVWPLRPRSVVSEPEPNGRVWLLVQSDRCVMVPEPNGLDVPERGCAMPARGGVGSAANSMPAAHIAHRNSDANTAVAFRVRTSV